MSILNRKSKEELDIETAMNIKMLKKKSEEHAKKCQNMAEIYHEKAMEAKEIGNQTLYNDFIQKSENIRNQAAKIKSFILIVQDMEMMRSQSSVMNDFAETMKSFIKSMNQGQMNVSWMAGMENELDKAIMENEKVGDFFGDMLQDLGQGKISDTQQSQKERPTQKKGESDSSKTEDAY